MEENSFPRYSERYFFLSPLYSDPGWYFRVRGGRSRGPFYRKEHAMEAAREYASECEQKGDGGGRGH